ncbi:MAG: hypothetical protein EAZ80_01635 [Runella slithyformis]|nr:MAG: hypothetical protein EAZ80_01635 [Runella slithyformis]TAF48669.1 MAG: hypothetical protein EAZ63_03720 [Runella slithyformis]
MKNETKMSSKVKGQIKRALARCEAEMSKKSYVDLYWDNRACGLRLCLRDGLERTAQVLARSIELMECHGRFSTATLQAEKDVLSDILTKWAI